MLIFLGTGRVKNQTKCVSQQMQRLLHDRYSYRCSKLNAQEVMLTMKELGMSLTKDDVAAMMRQAGVGPHGNIYYQGNMSLILIFFSFGQLST